MKKVKKANKKATKEIQDLGKMLAATTYEDRVRLRHLIAELIGISGLVRYFEKGQTGPGA
jgi:Zn-dependent M16 (insulinase) family peptidase